MSINHLELKCDSVHFFQEVLNEVIVLIKLITANLVSFSISVITKSEYQLSKKFCQCESSIITRWEHHAY
jgi:hypothetical protein